MLVHTCSWSAKLAISLEKLNLPECNEDGYYMVFELFELFGLLKVRSRYIQVFSAFGLARYME